MRRRLTRFAGAVLVVICVVLAARSALAGSASSSFSVTASVSTNCTISTAAVAFGAYDPLVANASTPLDATGSVTITCTKGAATTIGLTNGSNNANASGTNRAMKSGSDYLSYEIYQDSGRSTYWGNSGSDLYTPAVAPSKNARTFTTYGRVPPGQDVPPGSSYTDTVTATVNF